MLLFDMPLEQLYTYQGVNPRPDDFDAYWDAGLAQMRALDPQVQLIPAAFGCPYAECFDMYFTGVGGSRVYAQLLRPKNPVGRHPAVLAFHGYSGNSGDWAGKLPYVALGYTVAALDCRGQGGRSQDTGSYLGGTLRGHIIRGLDDPSPEGLYFRQVFLDTALLARIVMDMEDVDPARVGVMGGSQGGALCYACAALEPRINRAAPMFPFLSDYRRIWEMEQAKDAYQELMDWFRLFDPTHARRDEVFTRLGYIDIQHLAPRIRARLLMGTGLSDTICPPSTQFAAYNKVTAPKEVVLYPDYGHEGLPGFADQAFAFMAQMG